MRPLALIFTCLLWTPCLGLAQAKPTSTGVGIEFLPKNVRPPARDAITHSDFIARRAKREQAVPVKDKDRTKPTRPAMPEQKSYDLLATSTILIGDGTYTLIPRNGVIALPDRYKDRVGSVPEGRFQLWGEFLAANRNWVQTQEVTIEHARGRQTFDEEESAALAKRQSVVVATFAGNPISVNSPPPVPSAKDSVKEGSGLAEEPAEPTAIPTQP